MAYINQETKRKLAPGINAILKKYGLNGSLKIRSHSTLVLTIKSGKLDFISNAVETLDRANPVALPFKSDIIANIKRTQHVDVNTYHIGVNFSGIYASALAELKDAMSVGNWDRSDIQTDYFDVGWYVDILIGKWDKPYQYLGQDQIAA